MSERGGSVRSGSVARAVGGALGVHGGALVLDIGDEATLVVRPVSDDLDPAVRERHPVLPVTTPYSSWISFLAKSAPEYPS